MRDDEIDEMLAARALHALDATDRDRLDEALSGDARAQRRLDRDVETAALLGDAVAEITPPAHLRDTILSRIAETPQGEPAPETTPREDALIVPADADADADAGAATRRPRRRWYALAASVALLVAVGVGAVVQLTERPASLVALEAIEAADDAESAEAPAAGGGTIELHWSVDGAQAVAVVDGLPELDAGQQYELWFVRGEGPVSAGVFDGGSDDPVLLEGLLHSGDVVAVTVEQTGGSPSGAPTTEPIVAVPTV